MKEITAKEREATQLYDERDNAWKVAYVATSKRLETIEYVKAILFNAAAQTYTSKEFECAAFKEFMLMMDVDVTLAPTDITIWVQFSHDRINWFNLTDGPFGSLMYEDTAGDKKECVSGKIIAHWMRIYVVSSGCNATNTFKLSVNAEVAA